MIIAYRLSTIKNVGSIYVFDKGRVIEKGSHKELLSNQRYFFNLVKCQMGADTTTLKFPTVNRILYLIFFMLEPN